MKRKLKDVFHVGPGFARKTWIMIVTELLTGFFLSILVEVHLGTDPCTFFNVTVSDRLGISLGNWQVLFNLALFVIVIMFTKLQYLGVGTLANMFLIGYACDFGRWFFHRVLPEEAFTEFPARGILFAIGLFTFILCCGVYMNLSMGVSPYDALPMIISDHLPRLPFAVVRMCWDFGFIGLGTLLHGVPTVGNFLMSLFLGPIVGIIGRWMAKKFPMLVE